MLRYFAYGATLLASACVSSVASTPAGGILKVVGNKTGTALEMAQAKCSEHGKDARISGQNVWNNTITYDCVAR
jgi:hypothetical protein